MEECSWSHWDVWHAFLQGWAINTHCKLCVPLHVSACHLPPLCGHPQHDTHQGFPTPFNTRDKTSRVPTDLCNRASYAWSFTTCSEAQTELHYACEPTQGHRNSLSDPVPRLWEHYLSGLLSRLWETASLSCPDTCVRKPDCLCLPYTGLLGN